MKVIQSKREILYRWPYVCRWIHKCWWDVQFNQQKSKWY